MISRQDALRELTAAGQPYELVEMKIDERLCRVFQKAPSSLRELYASTRSNLPFIVYEDECFTFEEVWRRSCSLAATLVEGYGIEKGDRVAISMRNYPEWMIAFCAITSIGAIAVAMNAWWQPEEMEFALNDCTPRVLICDQERLDRFGACAKLSTNIKVIVARATKPIPLGAINFVDALERVQRDTMPEVPLLPEDDAIMLYTAGSTGPSKGVVSTHRNVLSALLSWELEGMVGVRTGLYPPPDLEKQQSSALLGVPLFHAAGSHAVFLQSFRSRERIICMYKWDPEVAAELIERERITSFCAPAAMTGDLVQVARTTGRDLSSLAGVGGGGAPRAPEQVRAIEESFANARPYTGWGMTETNAIGTSLAGEEYLKRPSSSGRISPVLDMRIVDESGNEVPPNNCGELQVRGASIMKGYWQRPNANAEAFVEGGWFRTGDIAYIDEEGFLYIVDRIKDLVIRGGENIGCGTVEAAILEHPDILEASVYGVPDERLGEELGVTICARTNIDNSELRIFLESKLASFQIPRYIRVQHTPLPRIASGKILKRQLRDEALRDLKE